MHFIKDIFVLIEIPTAGKKISFHIHKLKEAKKMPTVFNFIAHNICKQTLSFRTNQRQNPFTIHNQTNEMLQKVIPCVIICNELACNLIVCARLTIYRNALFE